MTNAQQIQEEIRNNIITMFGINELPVGEQEETINKIGELIFQSVLLRILPLLPQEDQEEYNQLVENKVMPNELFDFFFAKVPDFLQIVAEESENFRRESAEILSKIK